MQSLPPYKSCLFSISVTENTIYIEKLYGICSLTFTVDEFLGLFLHPPIFSIKNSRSS